MKILKKEHGITLVALVITIVVLLILVAVTLSLVLGDNGIVTKADEAKTASNQKEVEEQLKLKIQEYLTNNEGEFDRDDFLAFLSNQNEFTDNEDNTVTKDGVTLSIGEKGEVSIVNTDSNDDGNDNNYGTLTESWDISENQDESVIMNYYDDTKTLVVSGEGNTYYMLPYIYLMGGDLAYYRNPNRLDLSMVSILDWVYEPETLIIEEGMTSISASAFNDIVSLKTLIIPSSVTSIENRAFNELTNDSTIYCETQAVADLVTASNTNAIVIVDASKF